MCFHVDGLQVYEENKSIQDYGFRKSWILADKTRFPFEGVQLYEGYKWWYSYLVAIDLLRFGINTANLGLF